MAINNIRAFTRLTDTDLRDLTAELDAVRLDIERSRGECDARYIRRIIYAQRGLEVAGRILSTLSGKRWAWVAGVLTLTLAKIIENMEIGHNVMHGQWDWMNDPEIHSATWEWDMASLSSHWKQSHNVDHHTHTNILGLDADVGYDLLRVTPDQRWCCFNIGNLLYNLILAVTFEWGIGTQAIDLTKLAKSGRARHVTIRQIREWSAKARDQVIKDYIAFPTLTSLSPAATFASTFTANATANILRNIWAHAVIFCGHFPDGAEKFAMADVHDESQGEWYLRQIVGSANFEGGAILRLMSGNLGHQIEHHLFPDLPSNRLHEISARVKQLCELYEVPYTTGPFLLQYGRTWRTIAKLSLPDRWRLPRQGWRRFSARASRRFADSGGPTRHCGAELTVGDEGTRVNARRDILRSSRPANV
ncbi:fatty acid desaturase [Mycobacterium sp.]|uniref:fatty acid desaturase family protein n=1 Tax=Mycobacterium sp. TaxID=1785 RepID=UPI0025D7A76A|nr:fatty acid desaturase [Mycobacterium sp.]